LLSSSLQRKRADLQKTKTQGKDKSPAADQPQQQQEQEHDKQHHEQKKEGLGHGQEEPSVDQGLQQQQQQQQQPSCVADFSAGAGRQGATPAVMMVKQRDGGPLPLSSSSGVAHGSEVLEARMALAQSASRLLASI
jgi:hypothetical protein